MPSNNPDKPIETSVDQKYEISAMGMSTYYERGGITIETVPPFFGEIKKASIDTKAFHDHEHSFY
jgi:hypothetical protein